MTWKQYENLFLSYSVEVRDAMHGSTFVERWRVIEKLCELGIEENPSIDVVRAIRLSLSVDG